MSVSEFEWEPDSYLAMTLAEIPGYEELQTVADAAQGRNDVLELRNRHG